MGMSKAASDLDRAWEQVVEARARGEVSEEARALSLLEQALYQVRRGPEADEIGGQVVRLAARCLDGQEILLVRGHLWMQRGLRLEETAGQKSGSPAGSRLRKGAKDAYSYAFSAFGGLADPPQSLMAEVGTRLKAVDHEADDEAHDEERHLAHSAPIGPDWIVTIVFGFLAMKVLGPFLEEWAKALGRELGESTIQALGRIRLTRIRRTFVRLEDATNERGEKLEAIVSKDPLSLILPRHLSDAAKLAIIDLRPADDALRGKPLYWCESEGAWLPWSDRGALNCARHCPAASSSTMLDSGEAHEADEDERCSPAPVGDLDSRRRP